MGAISLKYKSKSGNLTAPGDVDPGAMIPIATTTLSTGTATITFSNIPQNYEHLQVRASVLTSINGFIVGLRLNSDSGFNYTTHRLNGNGSAVAAAADTSLTYARLFGQSTGTSTTSPTAMLVDILDYTNTNKYTTIRALAGCDKNGDGEVSLQSSLWLNTNAISSIQFRLDVAGNMEVGTSFALYGIKRAGA